MGQVIRMKTADFVFAWEHAESPDGPWAALQVVRFEGHEEISGLYRYDVTLLAKRPTCEVDPQQLVRSRATLRIATLTSPAAKHVHGVIVEAEEIGPVPEGMLYRVVLLPPLARAYHRTRSRIFLEKTTRAIIEAVLQGDPNLQLEKGATADDEPGDTRGFTPADERFTWRITDPSRIDDVHVRPYCVQYQENDLAFVSRLLEEEGISYHVENGPGMCLLVLSDSDHGKVRLDPFEPLGSEIPARSVTSMKLGARLRETAVRLVDYDWRKPALDLVCEAKSDRDGLFEHTYPGGYPFDAPSQGEPLANARLDRFRVEAEYAVGEGSCRVLSAGSIFALEHDKTRYEGEYLITKLHVRGKQEGALSVEAAHGTVPFTCSFECARRGSAVKPQDSRYRPPRVTPKPRILGSQTAFVTADPRLQGAEIHVGGPPGAEIGCVRLRFHWDVERARLEQEPSSCWVRVSQMFAGAGEGAVWHPRVGVEVIVEFIDGDPDRPIATGRVYNGANRPPTAASGAPTVSTLKSFSSPGHHVCNELSFDDAAGQEQIKLHAGRNWHSDVGHDRSERVVNDSTSTVGVNRTELTGGNRSTSVQGSNSETILGNESIAVNAGHRISVGIDQTTRIGADQHLRVAANRHVYVGAGDNTVIGASRSVAIGTDDTLTLAGSRSLEVSGNQRTTVSGNRTIDVSGAMTQSVAGAVTRSGAANVDEVAGGNFAVSAGAELSMAAGAALSLLAAATAVLQGANVQVSAAGEIILGAGGSAIKISGAGVEISGAAIKIAGGGSVDIAGGVVKIN
jgi:type VI secretion system secreted protein VgrG